MTLFPDFTSEGGALSAQDALRYPLGAASPLWLAYAGAASAGVAFWWMTQWTRPANLEAAFGSWLERAKAEPATFNTPELQDTAEEIAQTVEAVAEDAEAVVEVISETVQPVAEAAEAVAEQTVADTLVAMDDLTRIVGIGPKLAARLAELNVNSFGDIAAWTGDDLGKFDKALDLKGRAVRDAWVAQARRFAEA